MSSVSRSASSGSSSGDESSSAGRSSLRSSSSSSSAGPPAAAEPRATGPRALSAAAETRARGPRAMSAAAEPRASAPRFPGPPKWGTQGQWANEIVALRVILPCAGIDAPGNAMCILGWPIECVGLWETDPQCADVLRRCYGKKNKALHLGPLEGDITRVGPESLPWAHGLISGPPCPPWSTRGSHKSFADPRAQVFVQVLKFIRALARRGLLFYVLENVGGIKQKRKGRQQAPLQRILAKLSRDCPMFLPPTVWELNARDFGLAQSRPRVWIVGLRQESVRRPLRGPLCRGRRPPLAVFLAKLPNTPMRSLTLRQQEHVREQKRRAAPRALRGPHLMVFRADRRVQGGWSQTRFDDCVPTLMCGKQYLWIQSVGGPCSRLGYVSRFLDPRERAALQGFGLDGFAHLPASTLNRLFGNTMPVPVVGAVLHRIGDSLGLTRAGSTSSPASRALQRRRRRSPEVPLRATRKVGKRPAPPRLSSSSSSTSVSPPSSSP